MMEVERLKRVLLSLPDLALRTGWLRDFLARASEHEQASVLNALCEDNERADPQAREAILVVALLLASLVQSVPRDYATRAVVDECDLALAIIEHEVPTVRERHAAHDDHAPLRFCATEARKDGAIRAAQVGRGLNRDAHQVQPRHGHGCITTARHQYVEPLQHSRRITPHGERRQEHERECAAAE